MDETIVHYFAGPPDTTVFLALDSGYGFAAKVADMASRVKNGKAFIHLDSDETLLAPIALSSGAPWIGALSARGRLLVFATAELRTLSSGGRGVTLIGLDKGEKLKAARPFGEKGCVVVCLARNDKRYEVRITGTVMGDYTGKRGRRGKPVESRFTPSTLENIK